MTLVRWFLAATILLAGIGMVSYLQNRFDRADLRHAVEAVKLNRGISGECQGRLISRWKGWVEVTCPEESFKVDVVKGVITKGL